MILSKECGSICIKYVWEWMANSWFGVLRVVNVRGWKVCAFLCFRHKTLKPRNVRTHSVLFDMAFCCPLYIDIFYFRIYIIVCGSKFGTMLLYRLIFWPACAVFRACLFTFWFVYMKGVCHCGVPRSVRIDYLYSYWTMFKWDRILAKNPQ